MRTQSPDLMVARRSTLHGTLSWDLGPTVSVWRVFISTDEFQAPEVVLRPAGLLDHALQRLAPERVAASVKDNRDSPPIGVIIHLVRSAAPIPGKPVAIEGGNNLADGDVPQS